MTRPPSSLLVRINVAVPEAHVSPPVLNAALEATTRLNESLLDSGDVPLFDEVRGHIRWKPEPPGDEHFDHAGVVVGRRWGDCDDMAPYAAASMRHTGEDPGAKAIVKRSGPKRWHAVVLRSDGSIRDPSRETGMGQTNGVMGAGLPMMPGGSSVVGGTYIARPQLALRPVIDNDSGQVEAWQARADLPWHWAPGKSPTDVAMVSLHASPVSSQAVVGACDGLTELALANEVPEELLERAMAISDGCNGASFEDLVGEYGYETALAAGQTIEGFFGGLGNIFKKIVPGVAKVLPVAAGFIPGVGPIAAEAARMAAPHLQRMLDDDAHLPPQARPHARSRAPAPAIAPHLQALVERLVEARLARMHQAPHRYYHTPHPRTVYHTPHWT